MAVRASGAGWRVVLHYHYSQDEAESLAEELRAAGGECETVAADLASQSAVRELIPQVLGRVGRLDALVNNASAFEADCLSEWNTEDAAKQLQVNSWAPLELMSQWGRLVNGGCIVNLLDARIEGHDRGHLSYWLSKRILSDLTRHSAIKLAPDVRVNAIAPGAPLPPVAASRPAGGLPLGEHLLKDAGTVDGITDALMYLLSADSVTGQTIYVDGGQHLIKDVRDG